MSRRPSEEAARAAIEDFLLEEGYPKDIHFRMVEDGDEDSAPNKCGWAFWILQEDTTSYLHEDLKIEWYGSGWQSIEDQIEEAREILTERGGGVIALSEEGTLVVVPLNPQGYISRNQFEEACQALGLSQE